MDRTVLVSFDIAGGQQILNVLDSAGLRPQVALWAVLEEYGDARLVLASDNFDLPSLRAVDSKVFGVLDEAGVHAADSLSVQTFRMSDLFIRELRQRYASSGAEKAKKLGGQVIGGKYIEEAFVYRIE